MGNGAKAKTKRERDQKKPGTGVAKSQLKVNEAAKNTICQRCRQTFLCTVRRDALEAHSTKCNAAFDVCFPTYVDPTKK
ncbi:hypothetical protein LPJ61_003099 [Coemansia biformis]|uniref:Small EDRK-rich factor-like N-terminal domain-containing protein n=1 Tax=Coemansia biformis TaxID=1286918 RepID=A0A9W7YDN9_9FUNG|nr:hypothetical protein LPJ61_003099 [Coemansia biformis]